MRTTKLYVLSSLIVVCQLTFNFVSCYAIKPVSRKWEIKKDKDAIRINAGILEQKLNCQGQNISSQLIVNDNRVNEGNSGEIQVTFWKASPNAEPKGIEYSTEAGVEQTDAVKNQTDALAVKKRENKVALGVQWTDSLCVSNKNFGTVFNGYNCQYSEPGRVETDDFNLFI